MTSRYNYNYDQGVSYFFVKDYTPLFVLFFSFWQHLDFWSEPSGLTDTIFLRVSPQQSRLVNKLLNQAHIPHQVVISDLQRSVWAASSPVGSYTIYYHFRVLHGLLS